MGTNIDLRNHQHKTLESIKIPVKFMKNNTNLRLIKKKKLLIFLMLQSIVFSAFAGNPPNTDSIAAEIGIGSGIVIFDFSNSKEASGSFKHTIQVNFGAIYNYNKVLSSGIYVRYNGTFYENFNLSLNENAFEVEEFEEITAHNNAVSIGFSPIIWSLPVKANNLGLFVRSDLFYYMPQSKATLTKETSNDVISETDKVDIGETGSLGMGIFLGLEYLGFNHPVTLSIGWENIDYGSTMDKLEFEQLNSSQIIEHTSLLLIRLDTRF